MKRLLLLLFVIPLFGFGQIRTVLHDSSGNVLLDRTSEGNEDHVVHTHEPVRGFTLSFLDPALAITEKIIDDSDTSKINYYGNWRLSNDGVVGPDPEEGNCHCSWSQSQNDSLTYLFTGFNKLEWYGEQMSHHGIVDVYFDNVFQERIDTYDPVNLTPVINWSIADLNPDVVHKFKLVAPAERNPASTGANVVNQFIRVVNEPPVEPPVEPPIPTIPWLVENTSSAFNYYGEWSHEDATACACSYARLQTDSVVHVFKGARRVEWWGMTQPTDGKANVYLDGVFQGTIDTYASQRNETVLNWSKSGLDPNKEYHFRIVVTGTRNPESTGTHIVMRYLKFFPDEEPPPIEPPPVDPNNPYLLPNGIVVLASDYQVTNSYVNKPANSMDDDLDTRWSANGDSQWIQYELPEIQTIESLSLAIWTGHERVYTFDIQLGNDGVNWDASFVGLSNSGTTEGFETFNVGDTEARFIRILGHRNNVNDWNHISEARINIKVTIPPVEPPIDPPVVDGVINIVRQGYYLVFLDGVQYEGGHSEYDKAVEKAVNLAIHNPTANVIITAPTWRVEYE